MLVRSVGARLAVYMLRRSRTSRFMPAMYVFPGGAVDSDDGSAATLARLRGAPGPPGGPFVVAAVRELFEEAGILLAFDEAESPVALDASSLASLRKESAAGADFGALLARHELWLDAREVAYYSRWITPATEPIRFDAHFFLARAPAGQIAEADAVEVHDGEWVVPAEALERAERGDFAIIFPTRKHLERLAAFDDLDTLFAHARTRTVRAVEPEVRDGTIEFGGDGDAW
jgi:8-oxo-dGTP pyrophosphatase MutT (NUDIX family)